MLSEEELSESPSKFTRRKTKTWCEYLFGDCGKKYTPPTKERRDLLDELEKAGKENFRKPALHKLKF